MKKILIIENDELFAQNMKFQLEQDMYEVFNASNGEAALDLAKSVLPDLILSDINLSGMDGFAVCKEIRNAPSTKNIPFVFLTARSKFADKEKAIAIGANKFLTKPLKIKALKDVIYELIGKSNPTDEKLLLISEDSQYSNELTEYLAKQGYLVSLIGFSSDFANNLRLIQPTAIIIDSMQEFDSVNNTLQLISENPYVEECPIIVLGPKGDSTEFRKYMDTEISDYLVKPVEFGDVLHSIELQLEKMIFGKLLESGLPPDKVRFIDKEMEYAIATRKELRKRRQKCILLIEDDDNLISNLRLQLELNSYTVLSATDGERGLALAEQNIPDLIISDIMLPGISGYEVRAQLNSKVLTRNIPFLFHSAKVEYADIRKGMSLGADDYLTKPIKIKALLKIIKTKLSKETSAPLKKTGSTTNPDIQVEASPTPQEGIKSTDKGSFQKLLINARETIAQKESVPSQDSELVWKPILEEQPIPLEYSEPVNTSVSDNSDFVSYFDDPVPGPDEQIFSTFVPHFPEKSNFKEFQSYSRDDVVIIRVNISRCVEKDIKEFQLFLFANFRQEKTKYIIDLLKTEFMDSSFLGSLVVFQRKVIDREGELNLVVKKDLMMNNSMFLYGISRKFKVYHDVQSAINTGISGNE
jgi:DNA-binding response OmpR family regulator